MKTSMQAFLFTHLKTGRGYKLKTIDNLWAKYVGRKMTHYEASRHSFRTQISESGANLIQAKELMRHKDIRSTEKIFSRKFREVEGYLKQ